MTKQQARREIEKQIERSQESARELSLAPEFWEPRVEVDKKALEALEYYILVQSRKLPSYAEFCGRQSRILRLLDWMKDHMAEAEIEEMLEVYHDEPIGALLGDEVTA